MEEGQERLAVETDSVLRRNLETILADMKSESAGDIDGLLDTLADDVHYHAYGAPDPLSSPEGKDGVRVTSGSWRRAPAVLQLDIDRLVVHRTPSSPRA